MSRAFTQDGQEGEDGEGRDGKAQADEPEGADRRHGRRLRDEAAAPDGGRKQQEEVRLNARHFTLDVGKVQDPPEG